MRGVHEKERKTNEMSKSRCYFLRPCCEICASMHMCAEGLVIMYKCMCEVRHTSHGRRWWRDERLPCPSYHRAESSSCEVTLELHHVSSKYPVTNNTHFNTRINRSGNLCVASGSTLYKHTPRKQIQPMHLPDAFLVAFGGVVT